MFNQPMGRLVREMGPTIGYVNEWTLSGKIPIGWNYTDKGQESLELECAHNNICNKSTELSCIDVKRGIEDT